MLRRALLVLLLALGTACAGAPESSPSAVPCEQDAPRCPEEHTCWIDARASSWVCLDAGSGQAGEPCHPTKGIARCAAGMFCVQLPGEDDGRCTPYCDPDGDACAEGATCAALIVASLPQQYVCKI